MQIKVLNVTTFAAFVIYRGWWCTIKNRFLMGKFAKGHQQSRKVTRIFATYKPLTHCFELNEMCATEKKALPK